MTITEHEKIVSQKSEEAKYYDFSAGFEGEMVGSCEFIHNVFFCENCLETFEAVTQLNLEDIDIFIHKIKRKCKKKRLDIDFKKSFEDERGELHDTFKTLKDIKNFCITGYRGKNVIFVCKFPLLQKEAWERPYYFKIQKKKLIELTFP